MIKRNQLTGNPLNIFSKNSMLYVRQDPKCASEYITPLSANNGQTRLWGWHLKDYHTE